MSPALTRFPIFLGLLFAACGALGETVRISDESTTSAELPNLLAETLERLSTAPGERHEVVLDGRFKPRSTIKLAWWQATPLTVTVAADSGAVLDGASLPTGQETLFIAGRQLTISGLRFENSQGHALVVGGNSDRYTIQACSFTDCQQSAIHVWNDPHTIVAETEPRGWITENRIARFNLANAKWANDGITVFDQRVTIAGNSISDSPTETNAIRAMGRELLVERNRITNVSRDDAGGIYLWGGPHASLFRGNVVRWNHLTGTSRGIYLDDGTSGAEVVENLIESCSVAAIFVSGGRDNTIRGNVVDRAPVFLHLDSRCLGWDSRPEFAKLVDQSFVRLRDALRNKTSGPLLRERYPALQKLSENVIARQSYARPEQNRVRNNFVRRVESHWELMDFSRDQRTDFRALNDFESPIPFESSQERPPIDFGRESRFQPADGVKQAETEPGND